MAPLLVAGVMTTLSYHRFRARIDAFHAWHGDANWIASAILILGWAGLMGLLAQVRVPLFFTPVPLTLQVFGVLLGGALLGRRDGALAQVAYVGIGAIGVPWFQDASGGLAYLAGATGGYIVSWPIAAFLVAHLVHARPRRSPLALAPPMLAGLAVIYGIGVPWLAVALDVSLMRAIVLGALPFIAIDVAKGCAAALLAEPLVKRRETS